MPRNSYEQIHNPVTGGANNAYGADTGVHLYRVQAKTAAYQILENELGTIFTNTAATASITITLPPVTNLPTGWWCAVYVTDNDGIVLASSGSSDNIVGKNDAGLDTITMSTNSLAIGNNVLVIFDGTKWLSISGVAGTYTLA
jgi:hypothetical protein